MKQIAFIVKKTQRGVARSAQQPADFACSMTVVNDQALLPRTNATEKLLGGAQAIVFGTIQAVIALVILLRVIALHIRALAFSILKTPFRVVRAEVVLVRQAIQPVVLTQFLFIGFAVFLSVGQFILVIPRVAFAARGPGHFHLLSDAIVRTDGKHEPSEIARNGYPPAYRWAGHKATESWENKIGKKPTDNIFTSRALFFFFGENGFKEEVDGGRLFERTVMYAENTTNAMQGEMDTLDTTRINVFDAARFNQKIAAGTVVYSDLEKLRAAGGSQKFDLLAEKLQNGKDSHIALLNRQAWGLGLGANDLDGIQKIISITPTTGTVGGINGATFSFWRNRQTSGAQTSTAFDNLQSACRSVYNLCSLGGTEKAPKALFFDRASFEGFESTMTQLARYDRADRKSGGDPAFMNDALLFKGIPVFYDEDAPAGEGRFLNNDFLKFNYLAGGWMKMYPGIDPANQLSNIHKVATFGNITTSARRHLGVVSAIT